MAERPDRDRGAVIHLVAMLLVVVIVATSLAVDIGRVAVAGREARTVVDLAALDAARTIDSSAASGPQLATVRGAAERSAIRNGLTAEAATGLEVTLGVFDRATRAFTPVGPTEVADAVEVRERREVDNVFSPGSFSVSRDAVAGVGDGRAAVAVATTTVALDANRSAVLDAVLGRAIGGPVTLDAVSWQGLADAEVDLGVLAVELGLDAEDVDGLLDRAWGADDLVAGLAAALAGTPAGTVLAPLVGVGTAPKGVRLGDVVDASALGPDAELLSIGVMDLLWGVATAAVQGESITTALDLGSGLGAVPVTLSVVEAPVVAIGPVGTTARSAQLTASLTATATGVSVPPLTSSVLAVPVTIDTGRGSATITAIECAADPVPGAVGLDGTTAAASVVVGPADLLELRLVGVPVARVRADLDVELATGAGSRSFAAPFAWGGWQRVSATGDPVAALSVPATDLQVQVLGGLPLGVSAGAIATAAADALSPVLTDTVTAVLDALGVEAGVADLDVPTAGCRPTALLR